MVMNNNTNEQILFNWSEDVSTVTTGTAEPLYHECSTTVAPWTTNELLHQTFRWMFRAPQQRLVKDDVFFAPLEQKIKENITIPTPCLSPVTSPSDFLYDHEPLFDGIDPLDEEKEEDKKPKRKSLKRKIIELENELSEYKKKYTKLSHNNKKTVFEKLSQSGIDWCRYCGTTEGVNWRPGPWGKRTLCNKHGCDYKGYGLASRLPRLDLSAFSKERLEDRRRPIVQQFCVICQSPENTKENKLIPCDGGCSRAYHQDCHTISLSENKLWYCASQCQENKQKNKVVVDLPRKYLPLMKLQQQKKSSSLQQNEKKCTKVCLLY